MRIVIQQDGSAHCLYHELFDLSALGRVHITRASHVEPSEMGQWTADMTPTRGPVLGPFKNRGAAILAEQQWLESHWLNRQR